MERKKGNRIDYIILSIIMLSIITSSYFLVKKYVNEYKSKQELVDTIIEDKEENISISNLQNEYNNEDIKALLTIKSLDINTPVVQTTNNTYYLNHTLRKTINVIGTLFIDYENDLVNGKQINIYGHNSVKYDLPFKKLESYLDEFFYNNNKEITLKYDEIIETYEIFSIAIVNKTIKEEHMKFNFTTEEQWENHFKTLQNKSLYKNNLVLTGSDKILVLQTCLFGEYNGKLLIIVAKKISF